MLSFSECSVSVELVAASSKQPESDMSMHKHSKTDMIFVRFIKNMSSVSLPYDSISAINIKI